MSNADIFKGDALNRATFATNLTKHIQKIGKGVIAIDGEWGSGKSWFGERLSALLQEHPEVKCVWIDTFEADWHDDPAMTLLAEFSEQLPQDKRAAFIDAVAPLAGKALTAVAKAGMRMAGNFIGIDSDVVDEISSMSKDAGDEYIKGKLKDLAERKRSLTALRQLLAMAVKDAGGKVVVFVDELDRCSPPYAIRFLERIKHLFAVDGVVFVLLWNRVQIQNAVRTFYGQDTDGQMYLDRFVDFPCHLPNHHLEGRVGAMGLLLEAEVSSLDGLEQRLLHNVMQVIGTYADHLNLTAREVRHVCSWWIMSPLKMSTIFEVWLLCIKVKFPDLYSGLRRESVEAHQKAAALLENVQSSTDYFRVLDALRRFHLVCVTKDGSEFGEYARILFDQNHSAPLSTTSQTILRIESVSQ
jgi:hypothetical protein